MESVTLQVKDQFLWEVRGRDGEREPTKVPQELEAIRTKAGDVLSGVYVLPSLGSLFGMSCRCSPMKHLSSHSFKNGTASSSSARVCSRSRHKARPGGADGARAACGLQVLHQDTQQLPQRRCRCSAASPAAHGKWPAPKLNFFSTCVPFHPFINPRTGRQSALRGGED